MGFGKGWGEVERGLLIGCYGFGELLLHAHRGLNSNPATSSLSAAEKLELLGNVEADL